MIIHLKSTIVKAYLKVNCSSSGTRESQEIPKKVSSPNSQRTLFLPSLMDSALLTWDQKYKKNPFLQIWSSGIPLKGNFIDILANLRVFKIPKIIGNIVTKYSTEWF